MVADGVLGGRGPIEAIEEILALVWRLANDESIDIDRGAALFGMVRGVR